MTRCYVKTSSVQNRDDKRGLGSRADKRSISGRRVLALKADVLQQIDVRYIY